MIYTKTGDAGTTSLIGGTRVAKCHPRVEAYGTVDELGAHIALLAELLAPLPAFAHPCTLLRQVGRQLFIIQTLLALEPEPPHPTGIDIEGYSAQLTTHLAVVEQSIDTLQATLPPFRSFVIPGRVERRIVELYNLPSTTANPAVLAYINRLSDYLFILSRHLVVAQGGEESFL